MEGSPHSWVCLLCRVQEESCLDASLSPPCSGNLCGQLLQIHELHYANSTATPPVAHLVGNGCLGPRFQPNTGLKATNNSLPSGFLVLSSLFLPVLWLAFLINIETRRLIHLAILCWCHAACFAGDGRGIVFSEKWLPRCLQPGSLGDGWCLLSKARAISPAASPWLLVDAEIVTICLGQRVNKEKSPSLLQHF